MKKQWFTKLLACIMIGALVAATAGCGGQADSDTGSAPVESTDEESTAEPEGTSDNEDAVTIVYNSGMNFENWDLEGIYDGEINWVGYAENELNQKIMLEMSTGAKSFDICITPGFGSKMFASMGMLEELEPLADMDDIFTGNRNQHMVGDTIYGYPLTGDAMMLYINTEMWEAAGYTEADVPKTLEEYREKALHLTIDSNGVRGDEEGFNKDDVVQWGTMFKGSATNGTVWEMATLAYSNGASYTEKDYDKNTVEVVCNSKEFVDTLQYVLDMAEEGSIPEGFAGYDYDEVDAQWMTGNIGMYITWPYLPTKSAGSAVDGHIAVYPLPTGHSGKGVTCLGGWALHVFADAPHKEEAIKVAQALTSAEANYRFVTFQGSPSARKSVVERQSEAAKEEGNDVQVAVNTAYMDSAENGQETDIAMTDAAAVDAQTTSGQYINMAFTGQMTCQEAMDQLKVELEQIFADNDYMQGN